MVGFGESIEIFCNTLKDHCDLSNQEFYRVCPNGFGAMVQDYQPEIARVAVVCRTASKKALVKMEK